MALTSRIEMTGRTRFLVALSLSTATAIGVTAPLAMRAMNADDAISSANAPISVQPGETDSELRFDSERRLTTDDEAQGGIGSRTPVKGQAQTSKSSESARAPVSDSPAPAGEPVITNTDEPSTPLEGDPATAIEPDTPDAGAAVTTTVPTDPTATTTPGGPTTSPPTSTPDDPTPTTSTTATVTTVAPGGGEQETPGTPATEAPADPSD